MSAHIPNFDWFPNMLFEDNLEIHMKRWFDLNIKIKTSINELISKSCGVYSKKAEFNTLDMEIYWAKSSYLRWTLSNFIENFSCIIWWGKHLHRNTVLFLLKTINYKRNNLVRCNDYLEIITVAKVKQGQVLFFLCNYCILRVSCYICYNMGGS